MAEVLEAILELQIGGFTAALQQAASQVTAFAQAISGSLGTSAQVFQQQVQQINQVVTATRQAAQTTKDIAKDENEFQKALDATRLEIWKNQQAFKKRVALEDAAIAKQAATDNMAQERATGQFIMKELNERVAAEKASAAQILATWREAGARIEQQEIQAQQRAQLRREVNQQNATQNIRMLTGAPGSTSTGLVQQDLFLLQGYIGLVQEASQNTTFFEGAIALVGRSLKTLGGYFAASFLIAIPFAIAAWGKEAAQTALKMESLVASFKGITGSAAAAAQELSFLRSVSQRLGTDFLETAEQFKNISAAARGTELEGVKIHAIFEQVAMAQRVMGLTGEQAGRGFLALEQMISKGTITMEELRKQLSQAIPGSVGIMARSLGIGTDELTKMMKAGDLLASDVLPRFGKQLEKELGPGLETSMKTGQAAFARFGNNVRDISVSSGNAVLDILKPFLDFINKGFDAYNKLKAEAERERKMQASKLLGDLPTGITPDEEKQLQSLSIRLRQITEGTDVSLEGRMSSLREIRKQRVQSEIDKIKEAVKAREDYNEQLRKGEQLLGADTEGLEPFKMQKGAIKKILDDLSDDINAFKAKHRDFPGSILGDEAKLDEAKDRFKAIEKAVEDISAVTGKVAGLRKQQDPDIKKETDALNARLAAARKEIEQLEEAEELKKQMEADDKRRRAQLIAEEKQRAAEELRLRDDASIQIAKITLGETEAKLVALDIQVRKMREAKVSETIITATEATKRIEIYREEYDKFLQYDKGKYTEVANRVDKQEEIEKILASTTAKITKSVVDDFLAAQDAKLKRLKELGADEVQIAQLTADTVTGAQRIANEETEKLQKAAAKEAAKPWIELGNTIENALAGAFQRILSGAKNVFEGLRDAFLSIITKMAADAITHAIIIPAIINFVGGGGGGTGGSGGTLGSMNGGLSTAGAAGAAGGTLGAALGMASMGSGVSGLLGGPTFGSVLGGGGVVGALASTEIGTIGASYGSGIGASYIGQSTLLGELGIGSVSAGTVVGGIGAGIAVGMMLKQINNMIGIQGTAGSALAGAGGGALAGTMILPGIGTAIGAIVGAIGGALAGLLSKPGKKPGFDIESMQPGRIDYDEVIGMRITQNFKILDDFHQKLGTDYEDFIREMDNSINEMFQQVVSQTSSATPEVQRALVEPLNIAFQNIADQIALYPAIGGDKFKDQLEVMMKDFAGIFSTAAGGAVGDLLAAVKKIDPIIKAFSQIIESLLQDIQELQNQQKSLDSVMKGHLVTLAEASATPVELLGYRRQEFAALLEQFAGGDEATKIGLAPRIGELANAIMQLAKTVFNPQQSFGDITGIASALKSLEETLFTPAQTIAARQTDLMNLLQQFRQGDRGIQTILAPQISALALQIMELAKGVTTLAEQQALMADFPLQMRSITEALFSPAQSFLSEHDQLMLLMQRFRGGTPEDQVTLEPQIAQLAAQIIQRAKGEDVLGQDPQLLRQTQAELVSILNEVQQTIAAQTHTSNTDAAALQAVLERTQAELMGVLREVQYTMAGNIAYYGSQTVQAMWETAGAIVNTQWAVSNGIITAAYQTTNGVVAAQYNTSGQLLATQYYLGGVMAGASYNAGNAVVGATYDTTGQLIGTEHYLMGVLLNSNAYWNNGVIAANYNTANTVVGWSNYLAGIQGQLLGQVIYARDLAWQAYSGLINALWTEIGQAQYEIQLLVNSLYHLETVDAVVQRALGVLGEMNARLGNPLNVNMQQPIGEQLQRDAINVAQQSLRVQQQGSIALIGLAAMGRGIGWQQALDFGAYVVGTPQGFQHGGYIPMNMMAALHQGERVVPEWENRGGGGGRTINISVFGGSKDAGKIADEVVRTIERKSGRLQSTTIQTSKR